jgi:hypothetical protein
MLKRATVGGIELAPMKSRVNDLAIRRQGTEEVATFMRIMRSFLALDPAKRPRAAEALLDPAFKDILP